MKIPANAEHLSLRITLLGLVNMAGIVEYYASDGKTKLWGPVSFTSANMQIFEAGHQLFLMGADGESAKAQSGRFAYVVVDLNNYGMEPAEANVLVEVFAWVAGQATRIDNQLELFPEGSVPGKTDKRVSAIIKLI